MGFKLVEEFEYEGVPAFKYISEETSLQVVLFKVEGPLVNGYIAAGTEARDDLGCPHTLEHLIFLGSEEYPFKGKEKKKRKEKKRKEKKRKEKKRGVSQN